MRRDPSDIEVCPKCERDMVSVCIGGKTYWQCMTDGCPEAERDQFGGANEMMRENQSR